MIRLFVLCAAFWASLAVVVCAQGMDNVARVDAETSTITKDRRGNTVVQLDLSHGVPFRVFTLTNPARLVVDFRDTDWTGVTPADLLETATGIDAVRFGPFQPGWSRLVADLSEPVLAQEIDMALDPSSTKARLTIALIKTDAATFAAASGRPDTALWPAPKAVGPVSPIEDDRFVVMIDPGHGGIDPGAERDGVSEKELMLSVAFELRDELQQMGDIDVFLTRESDIFVSLQSRVAQAHKFRADLFISLHADALSQGGAQGATVYTLSEEASDAATAYLAARHNRADIIAGSDLTGSDDQVAGILLDLARQETAPRSTALAHALVRSMDVSGGPMNNRPLRHAGFAVLKSADIPSVLVEVGFLSSQRDLDNLRDPIWRSQIIAGMADGILTWRVFDNDQRALVRH